LATFSPPFPFSEPPYTRLAGRLLKSAITTILNYDWECNQYIFSFVSYPSIFSFKSALHALMQWRQQWAPLIRMNRPGCPGSPWYPPFSIGKETNRPPPTCTFVSIPNTEWLTLNMTTQNFGRHNAEPST
jgi:hypothetical protein